MERMPRDPACDGYILLWIVFIVAPLVAGLDKFFYLLTDWSQYLSSMFGTLFVGIRTREACKSVWLVFVRDAKLRSFL